MTATALLPRAALQEALRAGGIGLASDPARCRAFLNDFCQGQHRRDVIVLCTAVEENVPDDLLSSQKVLPPVAAISAARRKLCVNRGMEANAALWAVESWALALGICTPAECTFGEVLPAAPPVQGPAPAPAPAPAPIPAIPPPAHRQQAQAGATLPAAQGVQLRPSIPPYQVAIAVVLVVLIIFAGIFVLRPSGGTDVQSDTSVTDTAATDTGATTASSTIEVTTDVTDTIATAEVSNTGTADTAGTTDTTGTAAADATTQPAPPAVDTAAEAAAMRLAEWRRYLSRQRAQAADALERGDYDLVERLVAAAFTETDSDRSSLAAEREDLAHLSSRARELRMEEQLRASEAERESARRAYWDKRIEEIESLLAESKLPEARSLAHRLQSENDIPDDVLMRARAAYDTATERLTTILNGTNVKGGKTNRVRPKEKS